MNDLSPPGDDYNSHGSSLLSLVVGKDVGLLQKNRPILVKSATQEGQESGLRRVISHMLAPEQEETPIVAISLEVLFYDNDLPSDSDDEEEGYELDVETFTRDACVWAKGVGGSIQALVDAGATVLIAANNDEELPVVPDQYEAIALGPDAHKNRCKDQHGIDLPHVTEARLVSSADPQTGDWYPEVARWPGTSFVGAGLCQAVNGKNIEAVPGNSGATAWTGAVLVTIQQRAQEHEGKGTGTRRERMQDLYDRAQNLQHSRLGSHNGPKALWNGLLEFDHRETEPSEPYCEGEDTDVKAEQVRDVLAKLCGTGVTAGWDNALDIDRWVVTYAFDNQTEADCDSKTPFGCDEFVDKMINSGCGRSGSDGDLMRSHTTIDSSCGNATLTIEKLEVDMESDLCQSCTSAVRASECEAFDLQCVFDECKANSECQNCGLDCEETFKDKFCGVRMWHDFPMSGTIGAKTKMKVFDAWDRYHNPIGGAWGDENSGDRIRDNDEIAIRTDLEHDLTIKVIKWGGLGIWRYRKHFEFTYDTQSWTESDTDTSKAHCVEYQSLSAASNRNRYKRGWDCYWEC